MSPTSSSHHCSDLIIQVMLQIKEQNEQKGPILAFSNRAHQRIVQVAECIIGTSLLSLQDMFTSRCIHKATSMCVADPQHPSQALFSPLSSERRFCNIRSRCTGMCNCFFPQEVWLLNTIAAPFHSKLSSSHIALPYITSKPLNIRVTVYIS